MKKALLVTTALVAGGLLLLDPYSFGRTGGDVRDEYHAWQPVVAVVSALLLAGVIIAAMRDAWRQARMLLIAETGVFLVANAVFYARDGVARLSSGFASSGELMVPLIGGILIRLIAIALVGTSASAPRSVSAP